MPLRYRSTHFTADQCSFLGLAIYLLTTPTACEISGHVQTIAYIKVPTALAYGIRDIYSFSSFVLGHKLEESLKWEAKGTETGFTLFIPNLKSIFSIYFCYDNHSLPLLLSLKISMPKICLAAPRSFISNILAI